MQEEIWVVIPEFSDYQISSHGRVYNRRYDMFMSISRNNYGNPKITLRAPDGERYTRSVSYLVAKAFVEPPTGLSTQVVVLDGDFTNMAAENLVWRPDWFAWKYTRQMKNHIPIYYRNVEVTEITQNNVYASVVDAGIAEGLLFTDIWRSTYTGATIFPGAKSFRVTQKV